MNLWYHSYTDIEKTKQQIEKNHLSLLFEKFIRKNSSFYLFAEKNNPYENYINLKKLYIRWNRGLFYSKKYYKKYVTKYLINIIGNDILTDYDYFIISPEGIYDKKLTCKLILSRWLQIEGTIEKDSLRKLVEADPTIIKKWWRSKKFLSVHGKLRDFKLKSDNFGEVITLYLKDIRLKVSDNINKNSRK